VKVLDIGLAKVASSDPTMTATGLAVGTPEYMSPEVVVGRQADARSDVYALGAVLYFLFCGRPPFVHDGNPVAVLVAHANERPTPPSAHVHWPIPASLEEIVMCSLSKKPEARYASATEFARALARASLDLHTAA
jgi:serine/threonine-protein kinase